MVRFLDECKNDAQVSRLGWPEPSAALLADYYSRTINPIHTYGRDTEPPPRTHPLISHNNGNYVVDSIFSPSGSWQPAPNTAFATPVSTIMVIY